MYLVLFLYLYLFRVLGAWGLLSFDLLHRFSYIKFTLHTFGRPGSCRLGCRRLQGQDHARDGGRRDVSRLAGRYEQGQQHIAWVDKGRIQQGT